MKTSLAFLFAGLTIPLAAASQLPVDDFSQWKTPRDWKAASGQLEHPFTKWTSASTTLKLKKEGVHRVTFRYRTPGAAGVPLKIRIGTKVAAAFPATENWSLATVYFREKSPVPFAFIAEGKKPYTLQIKEMKLEALEKTDCRKIRLNADDGVSPFRTMKGEMHQTVKVKDHIDEGAAFLCRGNGAKDLRSIELPATPGRRYRLSFWTKGSSGTLRATVDGGWFPKTKYWSFGETMPVSEQWKKHSMEFRCPTEQEYPYLKRGLISCRFTVPAGQMELFLKGIELEELP